MTLLTAKSDKILRRLTGGTLIFVGIAGGIQSYTYLAELAITSGVSRSLAPLFPLSVDGLIIAGSLSLLRASLQQRRDFFAWSLVLLGSGLSIWGNIVGSRASGGGLVANAVHTIPVIAMIAALEAFLSALRHGYVQKSEKHAAEEKALALHNAVKDSPKAEEDTVNVLPAQEEHLLPTTDALPVAFPVIPQEQKSEPKELVGKNENKQEDNVDNSVETVEDYPLLGQRHRHSILKTQESILTQQEEKEKELLVEKTVTPARGVSKSKPKTLSPSQSQPKSMKTPIKTSPASEGMRTKAYQESVVGLHHESLTKQAVKVLEVHNNLFTGRISATEVSEALAIPLPQARKALERGRSHLRKVA